MIDITQEGFVWEVFDNPGECPEPDFWETTKERISSLLGPDGEPLIILLDRPKLGFDLRPAPQRNNDDV